MSAVLQGVPSTPVWRARARQLGVVLRIELGRTLFSRRVLAPALLCLLPIGLLLVVGLFVNEDGEPLMSTPERARTAFSFVYSAIVLGAVVFFGSAALFTSLFRGEILDRSLHYYLLTPMRREVLALGKYLAGLITSAGLFGTTTVIAWFLLYLPFGGARLVADLVGQGGAQLGAYLCVTLLACVGYGAVFTLMGLLFRNPVIPIAVFTAWEVWHFVLPPALKAFSVLHYLKSILPVPMDEGPLAVVAEPPAVWVSVMGLLLLAAGALVAAAWQLRRAELRYTED